MSSYLGPTPAIPTLSPTQIYADDTQPLRDQIDYIYTDVAFVVNDKARAFQYLQTEDITNDDWTTTTQDTPVPIYTKTLATGSLVAGVNTIAHGITGFGTLVNIRVMVTNGTNQRLLGYSSPTIGDCASVDVNATNAVITLGASFGLGYTGWIIMQYTKTV